MRSGTRKRGGERSGQGRARRLLADWELQRPDLSASIQRIRARLVVLGAYLARDNHLVAQQFGLTGQEMRILYALRRAGPPFELRPTDIQDALLVPSATVTRQVDRLGELGYAERLPNDRDRRGFWIRLTDSGRQAADAALTESVRDSALSHALERLDAQSQAELDRILRDLVDAMEASEPPDPG